MVQTLVRETRRTEKSFDGESYMRICCCSLSNLAKKRGNNSRRTCDLRLTVELKNVEEIEGTWEEMGGNNSREEKKKRPNCILV